MRDPSQDRHPFAAPSRITVVSGLPRSGTSLVLQILAAAGFEVAQDGVRPPDPDNPRGYFELEAVKGIRRDASFLEGCRGQAVKIVAPLLMLLPPHYAYRVLFIERDLSEILASQRKLLERQGSQGGIASDGATDEVLAQAFGSSLRLSRAWLASTPGIQTLFVEHRELVASTAGSVSRIADFLVQTGEGPRTIAAVERAHAAMIRAVEPALYRCRVVS